MIIFRFLLLRQHGLGQYLEEKYKTYTKTRCILDEQAIRTREYNGSLNFGQIKGAFYVLGMGLFLALLAFSVEVVRFRVAHNNHKIKRTTRFRPN